MYGYCDCHRSYALIFNRLSVLKRFLSTARPDASAFRKRDSLGNTVFHYCVFFGSDAAVDAVLEAARAAGVGLSGAGNMSSSAKTWSAQRNNGVGDGVSLNLSLNLSLERSRSSLSSALGADVENSAGMTPLHLAAACGNTRLAHQLVRLSLCSPAREDSRLGLRAEQWLAMCWQECEPYAWCTFAPGYGLLSVAGSETSQWATSDGVGGGAGGGRNEEREVATRDSVGTASSPVRPPECEGLESKTASASLHKVPTNKALQKTPNVRMTCNRWSPITYCSNYVPYIIAS